MINRLLALFAFLILAGCTAQEMPAPTTAVSAVTQAATMTPTPTDTSTVIPTLPPTVTQRATPTLVNLQTEPLPDSVALLDTTPTATATATVTPTPIATSAAVAGWLLYQSAGYTYSFSYPPEARVNWKGVTGVPTEEIPAGLTGEQYLKQVERLYPADICVTVGLTVGGLIISAPQDAGGRYSTPCGGFGIGAYDIEMFEMMATIDGRSYSNVSGYRIYERDEAATFRGEFASFELPDGTRLTYYAGPESHPDFETDYAAAYAAYEADKATLLQIIETFTGTAALRPTPTP